MKYSAAIFVSCLSGVVLVTAETTAQAADSHLTSHDKNSLPSAGSSTSYKPVYKSGTNERVHRRKNHPQSQEPAMFGTLNTGIQDTHFYRRKNHPQSQEPAMFGTLNTGIKDTHFYRRKNHPQSQEPAMFGTLNTGIKDTHFYRRKNHPQSQEPAMFGTLNTGIKDTHFYRRKNHPKSQEPAMFGTLNTGIQDTHFYNRRGGVVDGPTRRVGKQRLSQAKEAENTQTVEMRSVPEYDEIFSRDLDLESRGFLERIVSGIGAIQDTVTGNMSATTQTFLAVRDMVDELEAREFFEEDDISLRDVSEEYLDSREFELENVERDILEEFDTRNLEDEVDARDIDFEIDELD